MKRFFSVALPALLGLAHGVACAGDSLLRISCEGADTGAEIHVNGKFRGECPLDIKVQPGPLKLRVHKAVDRSRERAFELDMRMGEDSVKKIDALLQERFTAAGQVQEDQRLRAENAEAERKETARRAEAAEKTRLQQAEQRAAQQREAERAAAEAERLQTERERAAQLRRSAEAGDAGAQVRFGELLQTGQGVPKDLEKADYWFKQAAASGNELAGFLANQVSKSAPPEDVEAVKRMLRLPKEDQRILNARGHDSVLALVYAEPFFWPPEGGRDVSFSYENNPGKTTLTGSCQRDGHLAMLKGTSASGAASFPFESKALLAGLLTFESSTKLNIVKSTNSEIAAIESVYGTPFPLTEGHRFGVAYTFGSTDLFGGAPRPMVLNCMITDVKSRPSLYTPFFAPQLICLVEMPGFQMVSRWAFHEKSGCFVGMRNQMF